MMCRKLLAALITTTSLAAFAAAPLAAQQATVQKETLITNEQIVVLPKDVYVGDQMEIRYTFATSLDLSPESPLPRELTPPEMEELTILSMTLMDADSSGANGYVLSIQCIPWKSGIIDIPAFQDNLAMELDVPPISIQSILVHTGSYELRSVKPPVLIPGTTWIIWGLVLLIVAIAAGIILFLGMLKKHGLTLTQAWYLVFSKPYFRRAMRTLRRLTKKGDTLEDTEYAKAITQCIRAFLTNRFAYEFDAVSSSDTMAAFDELTGGTQEEPVLSQIEILEQILVRMDYVRFSGATDGTNTMTTQERQAVVTAVKEAVRYLEKGENKKEEPADAAV